MSTYRKSRLGKTFIKKADLLRELDAVLYELESQNLTVQQTAAQLATLDTSGLTTGARAYVADLRAEYSLDTSNASTVDGFYYLATLSGTGRWVRLDAPLANLAALQALDDTKIADGAVRRVSTVKDGFRLEKTSTAPLAGALVVSTLSGTGRWVRTYQPSPQWATQAAWYIDPAAGNDENSGVSQVLAVKTWAEVTARLRLATLTQDTTFWQVSSGAATAADTIQLDISVTSAIIRIRGVRTVSRSSTITGSTAPVLASNTTWNIADSSLTNWTADVSKMLVPTGASTRPCWVDKDLGSQTARISGPTQLGVLLNGYTFACSVTSIPYAVGETYNIVDLPTVTIGSLRVRAGGGNSTLAIDGLRISTMQTAAVPRTGLATNFFFECRFDGLAPLDSYDFVNCLFMVTVQARSAAVAQIITGLFRQTLLIDASSIVVTAILFSGVSTGMYLQGCCYALINTMGCFDSAGPALSVRYGSTAKVGTTFGNALYGSSNASGVQILSGSRLLKGAASVLAVTGSGGDLTMQAATSVRSINSSDGSITPLTTLSWANLALAVGSGGFGGTIMDILSWAAVLIG